jgi:hypothetical protein
MVHQLLALIIPPLVGLLSFFAISVGSFLSLLASSKAAYSQNRSFRVRYALIAARKRTWPEFGSYQERT